MEKSKKSINVEGGFLFCGGWNFSKSVSVGPTFIRGMRVNQFHVPKTFRCPHVPSSVQSQAKPNLRLGESRDGSHPHH